MPYELLRKGKIFEDHFILNTFKFKSGGQFIKRLKIPLLPCKYNGKTIYHTGSLIGVYLSEELKAVLPHGYQFKFLDAS